MMFRISFPGILAAALAWFPLSAAAQDGGGVNPTEAYATQKTCAVAPAPDGLNHQVTCQIVIDHPALVTMPFGDPPAPPWFTVIDRLTLNGQPIQGAVQTATVSTGAVLSNCANGQYLDGGYGGFPTGPLPMSAGYGCGVQVAPGSVQTTVTVVSLIPLGVSGVAQNCATSQHGIPMLPDALIEAEPSCVPVDLPTRNPVDPLIPKPVQCAAFTPEVTCNTVTGKPVVTLKNKYAKLFSPKSVSITSLTQGVTVVPSQSDALSVQLTGANPGDTITLSTAATEKGGGSEPGLDLCCMGEIEVTIPEGFICEAEQVLEVSKTCDTGINPAIDTDADCEITVHYEGPPPTAANPIKIVEAVTGTPWAFTTTPLSSDNWNCPPVPDATPFTCTISASDEPTANWQNWTSTLIVQMSVGEAFENCVTATAANGLEDKVCWSTDMPELTIDKVAEQEQCVPGQPCIFTITVSNPSTTDYSGPVTIHDDIVDVSPPLLSGSGTFTAITPPLCSVADLNSGTCTGMANILSGSAQSYTVTWIPPMVMDGADADVIQVTNCASGVSTGGYMPVTGAPDPEGEELTGNFNVSCATVDVTEGDISIVKTGPDECLPDQPCDFTVTISAGATGFSGPVLLGDQAPSGFEVTAITPTPAGCGVNLPAQNLACVIPVSLSGGESISYTVSVTPLPFALDTPFYGENCALLGSVSEGAGPADYSFSGDTPSEAFINLVQNSTLLGESCVPVTWYPDSSGEVTVVKTCTPLEEEDSPVLSYMTNCTITATVTGGVYPGTLYLTDLFTGPNGGTLGPMTPVSADWNCSSGNCLLGPVGPGVYQVTVPVTGIVLNQGEAATNCAQFYTVPPQANDGNPPPQPVVEESCVTLTPPDIPDPDDDAPPPTIAKTCSAPVAGPFGLAIDCTIVVTSMASPQPHHLTVTETLGQYLSPSDTGASIQAFSHADPWTVSGAVPVPPATPVTLTLMGTDMPASGQSTITASVQLMNEGYLVETENCATVQAYDAANQPIGAPQEACASFTQPTQKVGPTAPVLTLAKTATGPCVPDVGSQTYACGFDLTVTNSGAAFAGPMVLGDAFDPGTVSAVSATGAGWSCALAGDAASCINGNLSLAAGASSSVPLAVTVKGQRKGGTFTNCGSLGASDDPKAQTIIVQTALTLMGVDIGAVDGVAGKRTRAAVADLQAQLGLEPTGQIDAALLQALGVPMAAEGPESCVTVDLPPMPEPPLQCEKATTVAKDGACACRYKNMYQADRNSCGCVKGTEFVAGEGCLKVKVKDKPKDDTPKALKCDPETTVLRDGKCQCREEGMERVSKTACARPKKKKEVEVRICPNGLPEIPGVGCIDIKRKEKVEDTCNPVFQDCG